MSHRSIELLIEDLWEAVEKVERYTVGFDHDRFVQDEKTIDSVVRNFEIVGEAANKLPPEFRENHPDGDYLKTLNDQGLAVRFGVVFGSWAKGNPG